MISNSSFYTVLKKFTMICSSELNVFASVELNHQNAEQSSGPTPILKEYFCILGNIHIFQLCI